MENKERKFLHDISSPVGTAIFVLDMVMDDLQSTSPESPSLPRIQQAYALLEQIKSSIEGRRKEILSEAASEKSSK